jgi:hypothetical protein
MTVSELIDILRTYPADATVAVRVSDVDNTTCWHDAPSIVDCRGIEIRKEGDGPVELHVSLYDYE